MDVRVPEFAMAASDYVKRATGLDLDGSVESLAYVDHYLATVGEVSDEMVSLLAPALGAYFGEVIVSHLGGDWASEGRQPADWSIAIGDGAPLVTFRPVAMAAEALRRDDVEGYDASLVTPPELEGPLDEALSATSPVEESYYYSLTGRLETIEHVLELLVELRRRSLS
jgi:hypothetical protein